MLDSILPYFCSLIFVVLAYFLQGPTSPTKTFLGHILFFWALGTWPIQLFNFISNYENPMDFVTTTHLVLVLIKILMMIALSIIYLKAISHRQLNWFKPIYWGLGISYLIFVIIKYFENTLNFPEVQKLGYTESLARYLELHLYMDSIAAVACFILVFVAVKFLVENTLKDQMK